MKVASLSSAPVHGRIFLVRIGGRHHFNSRQHPCVSCRKLGKQAVRCYAWGRK
jgi:hypothetical protein